MGLDSFIRKISKAKAHAHGVPDPPPLVGAPFYKVPGHASLTQEIAYWRRNHALNKEVMALITGRDSDLQEKVMNGAPILLTAESITALKMEAIFGDTFSKYWRQWDWGDVVPSYSEARVKRDILAFDRALRIAKRNLSYIYYVASW